MEDTPLLQQEDEQTREHVFHPFILGKRYLAELLGTAILVLIGDTTIMLDTSQGVFGPAFGYSLGLLMGIHMFGAISGAHFNPAVTLAMLSLGKINLVDSLFYFIAQMIGATVASLFTFVLPNTLRHPGFYGCTVLADFINPGVGILIETIGTAILVTSILINTNPGHKNTPFAIAYTLGGLILYAGKLTGASYNPARSFGPAVVWNYWSNHYVYWIGPPLGALIGAALWKFVWNYPPPKSSMKIQ